MSLTTSPTPTPYTTSTNTSTTNTTTPTPSPPTPSSLPPAALDLANSLFTACRHGNHTYLNHYLTAGIPPNLRTSTGDTFLMLAAYHAHASLVALLLAHGADPNILNDRGQSPLAGAVFKGHERVARMLYAAGADARAGRPDAVQCAWMFRRGWAVGLFGVEEQGEEGERLPEWVPRREDGVGRGHGDGGEVEDEEAEDGEVKDGEERKQGESRGESGGG